MEWVCLVSGGLRTVLGGGVGYVIHHNHPSLVVDFPKNMKIGKGKKSKERNARKMEEEGPGDEAIEIEKKSYYDTWGNNGADSELFIGGSTLFMHDNIILHDSRVLSKTSYRSIACAF